MKIAASTAKIMRPDPTLNDEKIASPGRAPELLKLAFFSLPGGSGAPLAGVLFSAAAVLTRTLLTVGDGKNGLNDRCAADPGGLGGAPLRLRRQLRIT